jgi:hypothetical protein
LTEKELIDLLGIKKEFLDQLRRNHKLPFCKISTTKRVYLVEDIVGFVRDRRMVLDRHS